MCSYQPREFPFQYPIILPFHAVHGVPKARILKPFAIPFSSESHSVRPLQHNPSILGGPTWLGLVSLTRLSSMWSDWLVFCDYCFSVSALWCPLATPTVLLGFLLPWMWGISSQLLQQTQPLLLTLDEVTPPNLEGGVAPLGPPAPMQLPRLGRGFASSGHCPWPWTWGSSSQPHFCTFRRSRRAF